MVTPQKELLCVDVKNVYEQLWKIHVKRRIEDPFKHLRWNFLGKCLRTESCQIFSQSSTLDICQNSEYVSEVYIDETVCWSMLEKICLYIFGTKTSHFMVAANVSVIAFWISFLKGKPCINPLNASVALILKSVIWFDGLWNQLFNGLREEYKRSRYLDLIQRLTN